MKIAIYENPLQEKERFFLKSTEKLSPWPCVHAAFKGFAMEQQRGGGKQRGKLAEFKQDFRWRREQENWLVEQSEKPRAVFIVFFSKKKKAQRLKDRLLS